MGRRMGRLIDADALITAFRKKWNDEHPVYEDTSGSMTYSEIIDFIRSFAKGSDNGVQMEEQG